MTCQRNPAVLNNFISVPCNGFKIHDAEKTGKRENGKTGESESDFAISARPRRESMYLQATMQRKREKGKTGKREKVEK